MNWFDLYILLYCIFNFPNISVDVVWRLENDDWMVNINWYQLWNEWINETKFEIICEMDEESVEISFDEDEREEYNRRYLSINKQSLIKRFEIVQHSNWRIRFKSLRGNNWKIQS